MAEVFISYARPDAQQAARVVEGLESAGHSLWWDSDLAVSDDFGMRIEEELAAARCVVVAWSAAARHSLWVRAEATAALEADKLVQVSLDAGKPPLRPLRPKADAWCRHLDSSAPRWHWGPPPWVSSRSARPW